MISERFTEVSSYKVKRILNTKFYKSQESGITVCSAQTTGPLIHGYFCLATKCFNDEGLPHTLEHLVFSGSKTYPYKGILDVLANRCFAQGTNAWTSLDHTCYTVETASAEGFLNLLPVYLDHILFPIFGEAEFATEVYQKNEQGEESGVVFSEMKARENTKGTIMQRKMMKLLYPKTSGYTKISGGLVGDIPNLNLDKIKEYHRKYYIPQNVMVVVCGSVPEKLLLNAIMNYEDSVKGQITKQELFERPWIDPIPLVSESTTTCVNFVSDDAENASVWIAITGTDSRDTMTCAALEIVMCYLTMPETGPLWKALNTPDLRFPHMSFEMCQNSNVFPLLIFNRLDEEKARDIESLCKRYFTEFVESDVIDMEALGTVLQREYMRKCEAFEDHIEDKVVVAAIQYFLFGQDPVDASKFINEPFTIKKLMTQSKEFWSKLIKKHLVEMPMIVLKAFPTGRQQKDGDQIKAFESEDFEEENRKKIQKTNHASDTFSGLATLFHNLLWSNPDKPKLKIPDGLLAKFEIPNLEDLNFHSIMTSSNFGKCSFCPDLLTKFDLAHIPFALQLDDITSDFIEITLSVNVSGVNPNLKKYIPFFCELPLSLPVKHKDKLHSLDEVLFNLRKVTLSFGSSLGWNGGTFLPGILSNFYFLRLKSVKEHYRESLTWLHDLLFNFCPEESKIKELLERMMAMRKTMAADGMRTVDALFKTITYNENSIIRISNILEQNKILQELSEMIEKDPKQMMDLIEMVRSNLKESMLVKFHLSCDFEELVDLNPIPHQDWLDVFPEYLEDRSNGIVTTPSEINKSELNFDYTVNLICGVNSIDCAFLNQAVPIVMSYRHKHYPVLLVLMEYLQAAEGPLWKVLRGKGLCYGFRLIVEPADGILQLIIFRSIDIVAAYEEALNVLKQHSLPECILSVPELEAAKSGVIFTIAHEESSVNNAANQKFLAQMKGTNDQYHRSLMKQVCTVGYDAVKEVAGIYLPPFLNALKSHLAISCPTKDVDSIVEQFHKK